MLKRGTREKLAGLKSNKREKKRKEAKYGRFSKVGESSLEQSLSQSWPRFSLVFPRYYSRDIYIYLLFFAKATPLFRSPRFFTVWPPTFPSSSPLRVSRRPVSFRSAPAKAGQYIILAVSLFLRTKASSKLEKPRHARNGRNPGPECRLRPREISVACVRAFLFSPTANRIFDFSRAFIDQLLSK